MVKVLMIMQHITLFTLCIAFMLVDQSEQGHEKSSELAQVKGANSEQE
jgi:hypothetical protein